jgi:hypothetical protein
MKKSFLSLLACAALVACAAGPDGAVGAAGVQGPQGEQGVQGEAGANGADAPAREGSIVSVTGGSVVAGSSAEMHVMGQYTEWTEAPEITTDYPGISLSAVVTSPVSMVITITAAEDVRSGEANLVMGDLQLPKTVEVTQAATFILDEGQANPVRPGQTFSGTIEFAPGFSISGSSSVKWNLEDDAPEFIVLTESLGVEGPADQGVTGLGVTGLVAPNAVSGEMNWRVITLNAAQTIPVYSALQIQDSPAVDMPLDGTIEATLENGFGLYRLARGENPLIPAGTVVRVEVQNADFPVNLAVSLPASGDDRPALWTNEDVYLEASSNTVEFIAPRTAAYFASVDHGEGLAGAELTYSIGGEQIEMVPATGQPQEATLARPGHGAWFARSITAGQTLTWSIVPGEDSDATPALYPFRNFTDDDGVDVFGQRLVFYQGRIVLTGAYLYYPGRGVSWPESWGESLYIWRVVDQNLGGGGGYTISFTGNVE